MTVSTLSPVECKLMVVVVQKWWAGSVTGSPESEIFPDIPIRSISIGCILDTESAFFRTGISILIAKGVGMSLSPL